VKRREFITLLGGAAAAWPVGASAQPTRLPIIGFLGVTTPAVWSQWTAAFVGRLSELFWMDGRTVAIEYRWTDGRNERLTAIVAEFVRLKVDVVVTAGPAAVIAAREAMPATPIVFAIVGDPVGTGLVASIGRPSGTVTGMSMQHRDTVGKRLEVLREVVPDLRRVAIMGNVVFTDSVGELTEVEQLARTLGLEVTVLELRRAEDISPALESLNGRAQALYICVDPLVFTNRIRINTLAQGARLPTIYAIREYVEAGGLLAYGPNISDMFRRTAEFVDKILHGTKPADIPIEQPTKFDLVVNMTTAKALGMKIPESFLLRANEVIE